MLKRSFWTNAQGFSIVDLLAISYSATYLMLIISNIFFKSVKLTDVLSTMSPPIMVILGGYFTGQALQQFNLTRPYRYDAVQEENEIRQNETRQPAYTYPPNLIDEPYFHGSNKGNITNEIKETESTEDSPVDYSKKI